MDQADGSSTGLVKGHRTAGAGGAARKERSKPFPCNGSLLELKLSLLIVDPEAS